MLGGGRLTTSTVPPLGAPASCTTSAQRGSGRLTRRDRLPRSPGVCGTGGELHAVIINLTLIKKSELLAKPLQRQFLLFVISPT